MLSLVPRPYRKGSVPIRSNTAVPPTPVALTLVAAEYEPGVAVTLLFDRAVSLDGIHGDRIVLFDPTYTMASYDCGGGAARVSANAIELRLRRTDEPIDVDVVIFAPPNNGIHATDGGAWAGTDGTLLPFP